MTRWAARHRASYGRQEVDLDTHYKVDVSHSVFHTRREKEDYFLRLPEEVLGVIFGFHDARTLARCELVCTSFRKVNRANCTWRALGVKQFQGLEVEGRGTYPLPMGMQFHSYAEVKRPRREASPCNEERRIEINWKARYANFSQDVLQFRNPFPDVEITTVTKPDDVAYNKLRLLRDDFQTQPELRFYMEVRVFRNADNLSLAMVDFDEGGRNSLTFSPDTGAIIRETKVRDSPRRVIGSFYQPLKQNDEKFQGRMGLYIHKGLIAFFRQYNFQPWESTGFCVNFGWAAGKRITPCLAFRDPGQYKTSIVAVSTTPPFEPEYNSKAFHDNSWDLMQ
jgi:hypothetical protein